MKRRNIFVVSVMIVLGLCPAYGFKFPFFGSRVAAPRGKNPVVISAPAMAYRWSPDGQTFVYIVNNKTKATVYTYDLTSGTVTSYPVPRIGDCRFISPDITRLLYIGDTVNVMLTDLHTSKQQPFVSLPPEEPKKQFISNAFWLTANCVLYTITQHYLPINTPDTIAYLLDPNTDKIEKLPPCDDLPFMFSGR